MVLILELLRAQITERRMKPACVVDLLYEVGKMFIDIFGRFESHRIDRFNLQRFYDAFSLGKGDDLIEERFLDRGIPPTGIFRR